MLTLIANAARCRSHYYNAFAEKILNEGSKEQSKELQELTDRLAEKMGIHKKVELVVHPKFPFWHSLGINSRGRVGICVDPGLFDPSSEIYLFRDAIPFILAHELAHIKHNDDLWLVAVPAIASIALLILFNFYIPLLTSPWVNFFLSDALAMMALFVSKIITSRIFEMKADLEACKYTTDAEKTAFINHFKFYRSFHLIEREDKQCSFFQRLIRKIQFDSRGNNRFDLNHPYLTTRILAIEKTMSIKPEPIRPLAYFFKRYRNNNRVSFAEHLNRTLRFDKNGHFRSAKDLSFEKLKERILTPIYPLRWLKYQIVG